MAGGTGANMAYTSNPHMAKAKEMPKIAGAESSLESFLIRYIAWHAAWFGNALEPITPSAHATVAEVRSPGSPELGLFARAPLGGRSRAGLSICRR